MSAGVMPKLSKTEPWELIQAFAEAQNQAAAQEKAIAAQRQMEAMREAGQSQRMERAHALGLDKMAQELSMKEPYEQRAAALQQQNALEMLAKRGEQGQADIRLQGEVNTQTHRSNTEFDADVGYRYGAKKLEQEEPYKERAEQRLQERQQSATRFSTDEAIRQQRELEPLQEQREARTDTRQAEAERRRADLGYTYKERGAAEDEQRQIRQEGRQVEQQTTQQRAATDEAIRRAKELHPLEMEKERVRQEAISGRQIQGIEARGAIQKDIAQSRAESARSLEELRVGASQDNIRLKEELRQQGRVQLPDGTVAVDPSQIVGNLVGGVDFNDQNKWEFVGTQRNPSKPVGVVNIYRQKGGASASPGAAPGVVTVPNPLTPGGDTGVPAGKLPNRASDTGGTTTITKGDRVTTPPPASATPNAPAPDQDEDMRSPTPRDQLPTTDWLRRDQRSDIQAPRGRLQYASLDAPTSLPQMGDGGVTNAPKDRYVRDIAAPVTTSGKSNTGRWMKTVDEMPAQYRGIVDAVGRRFNINPDLLAAQSFAESRWNPNAHSPAGAHGISQFMPGTARDYGVNPSDPASSFRGQADYMSRMLKRYNGNIGLALASYNAGAGRADQYLQGRDNEIPAKSQKQTRDYVQKITGRPLDWWVERAQSGRTPVRQTGGLQEGTRERLPDRGLQYEGGAPQRSEVPLPPRRPQGLNEADQGRGPTYNLLPDDPPSDRVQAFIVHHTARGDLDQKGTQELMRKRNVGANYFMERDGSITQLVPDSQIVNQIRRGLGPNGSLNNGNILGIEVRANDDKDVTPAQVESFKRFYGQMLRKYPNLRLFSHGEIDSPHKQETEGKTLVDAVRRGARQPKRGEELPAPSRKGPRISRTDNPDLFYVEV